MDLSTNFLQHITKAFEDLKSLSDKSFAQLEKDEHFTYFPDSESNSLAVLVKHVSGNMVSRFTDFLTTDGEKANRNRDREFENDLKTKKQVLEVWEKGWNIFLTTLRSLTEADLLKIVVIRSEKHTVSQALIRQLSHYAYHTGQIVYLTKIIKQNKFNSLSIPKGKSDEFNQKMMGK